MKVLTEPESPYLVQEYTCHSCKALLEVSVEDLESTIEYREDGWRPGDKCKYLIICFVCPCCFAKNEASEHHRDSYNSWHKLPKKLQDKFRSQMKSFSNGKNS